MMQWPPVKKNKTKKKTSMKRCCSVAKVTAFIYKHKVDGHEWCTGEDEIWKGAENRSVLSVGFFCVSILTVLLVLVLLCFGILDFSLHYFTLLFLLFLWHTNIDKLALLTQPTNQLSYLYFLYQLFNIIDSTSVETHFQVVVFLS